MVQLLVVGRRHLLVDKIFHSLLWSYVIIIDKSFFKAAALIFSNTKIFDLFQLAIIIVILILSVIVTLV